MRRATNVDLEVELVELCKEALELIVLDPRTKVRSVKARTFRTFRFGFAREKTIYVITITTTDATMVRGAAGYKGSYKERLEGLLDFLAKKESPLAEVYVDIEGPQGDSAQKLVDVKEFVATGRVEENSPIVRTAREFGIPEILIRGRHVIAPSPAIAEYLGILLQKDGSEIRTALDLFGGTGLAAKVLCKRGNPLHVLVVEKDPRVLGLMRAHIQDERVSFVLGDAFTYDMPKRFDLVLADPYYEDALEFIRTRLEVILRATRILLLIPGNVEDVAWNASIEDLLKTRQVRFTRYEAFGQVILDVRSSSE